jgi:hypothetical protein
MASEESYTEPELEHDDDSEISAVFDIAAVGTDGIYRPVWVNQGDEDVLALTLQDAERLHKFLTEVIKYVSTAKHNYIQ